MRNIKFRATDYKGRDIYWTPEDGGDFWNMVSGEELRNTRQFTGTFDKNGKEVYDGDIIYFPLFPHTPIHIVYSISEDADYDANEDEDSLASLVTKHAEVTGRNA
jgi:hypothetical protein